MKTFVVESWAPSSEIQQDPLRSILSCQVKCDLVQHPYLTRLEEGKLQGHHIQIYYNETNFITNFSKEELNSEQVQISTSKYYQAPGPGSGPGHAWAKVHVKVHVKVQVSSKLKIEFSES